jgi:hypothetical protein
MSFRKSLSLFLLISTYDLFAQNNSGSTIDKSTQSLINIRFDYSSPHDPNNDLKQVVERDKKIDSELFKQQSHLTSNSWDDKKFFSSQTTSEKRKEQFLQGLTNEMKGKDTVQFNLSGHGVLGTDGKWYLALPTQTSKNEEQWRQEYYKNSSIINKGNIMTNGEYRKVEVVDVNKSNFKNYFISMSEIAKVAKDAGVNQMYGTIGACYSEAIKKDMKAFENYGINASFIAGTTSTTLMAGDPKTGSRTSDFLNQIYSHPSNFDSDKDGKITWNEIKETLKKFEISDVQQFTSNKEQTLGKPYTLDRGFHPRLVESSLFLGFKTNALDNQTVFEYSKTTAKESETKPSYFEGKYSLNSH